MAKRYEYANEKEYVYYIVSMIVKKAGAEILEENLKYMETLKSELLLQVPPQIRDKIQQGQGSFDVSVKTDTIDPTDCVISLKYFPTNKLDRF